MSSTMLKESLLSLALSMALVGPALAQTPVRGGVANVVIQPEPPGLMLGLVQNGPTQMVAGNIYEGLLRYNEKLEPQPSLAESWTAAPDGKSYAFKLKPGVKWHDGKPFTSADVLFSIDFLKQTHPRARANMAKVASVAAPDDATIVFTLTEPFGPFLGAFEVGSLPMIPKHIYEGTDFKTNPANNTPIGTGPYLFKEWRKGAFIRLVRNPDYHVAGRPYIDEIYWHVIPDAAARAVAYETGKVDVLPGGSVENFDVARLKALPNTCITEKGWEFFGPQSWLWLNNRSGPTSKKAFRQAIMHAMDRGFAKEVVWNGFGGVSVGPIGSSTRFFDPKLAKYDFDPAKAKALLKEAGYKGETVRLLPLPYGETWQRWAEAVRQNLQEVGIKVELVATDVAGWNQKVSEWDYDLAFTYLYQYGDPALGVARSYVSSQIAKGSPWNNVEGYANPKVDELFAQAATAVPDANRQKLYDEVQKILIEDVPVGWLLDLKFPTISRCKVKDLVTTAIGVNDGFRDAWIAK
jgi:peptide/nickel transport system substrate-binding protein